MFRILISLYSFIGIAQQPVFDGIVSAEEWQYAQQFSIPYEIEPSDNGPAHYKTEVFAYQVGNDLFDGESKNGDGLFVGGSQGYGKGEIAGNLDIDSSQLYFKFQYLFEI